MTTSDLCESRIQSSERTQSEYICESAKENGQTSILPKRMLILWLRTMAMIVVGLLFFSESLEKGWDSFRLVRDSSNLNRLNDLVRDYNQIYGAMPDTNLTDLYRSGLSRKRIHPTPYGGYYRVDLKSGLVYNPNR